MWNWSDFFNCHLMLILGTGLWLIKWPLGEVWISSPKVKALRQFFIFILLQLLNTSLLMHENIFFIINELFIHRRKYRLFWTEDNLIITVSNWWKCLYLVNWIYMIQWLFFNLVLVVLIIYHWPSLRF